MLLKFVELMMIILHVDFYESCCQNDMKTNNRSIDRFTLSSLVLYSTHFFVGMRSENALAGTRSTYWP